jgi:hypothetical protein
MYCTLGLRVPQYGQESFCVGKSKQYLLWLPSLVLMLSLWQALAKLCNGAGIGVLQ